MRVALISACFGMKYPFDTNWVAPKLSLGVELDVFKLDDKSMPLRSSMTPILQAKIPKILGWKILPGYDYYIWVDASFSIPREDSVMWLLEKCIDVDAVFFHHNHRQTVEEEYKFLQSEGEKGNPYIVKRYKDEVFNPLWLESSGLFACGCFCYHNNLKVQRMMENWWAQVSQYHINDQLSFPYVWKDSGVVIRSLDENIMHNKYFKHHSHK